MNWGAFFIALGVFALIGDLIYAAEPYPRRPVNRVAAWCAFGIGGLSLSIGIGLLAS